MSRWTRAKSLRSLAALAFGGILFVSSVGGAAQAALNLCPGDPACGAPCTSDSDCNCNSTQQASSCDAQSGAGGVCTPSSGTDPFQCFCNPGYSPPNCASGACCSPDGSCTMTGQIICEDGGTYQGDNVSCSAVTCPKACGFATAPECGGTCPTGQVCTPIKNGSLTVGAQEVAPECECVTAPTPTDTATPTVTPTSTPSGTATTTPTVTQTSTQTNTPTNTPAMEGAPCDETADCEGGLVCEAGICTQNTSPAPLASERGVLLIIGLLLSVGALAILRRKSA